MTIFLPEPDVALTGVYVQRAHSIERDAEMAPTLEVLIALGASKIVMAAGVGPNAVARVTDEPPAASSDLFEDEL